MLLKKSFSKFLKDRVNLNQSRIDRIVSSHHSVRDKLAEDDWVSDHLVRVRTRLQGSYALGTAIRSPHESGTYDVDVVLGLKLMRPEGLPSGYSVLKKTRDALEAVPLYSGKTEILRCCVRVAYAHDGLDFHLDVVPTHVPDEMSDPLQIPREWEKTNPIGYINWFNDQNRKTSGYLRKVVRLLKYWRDLQQLESPNSMVITTLAGQFIPGNARSVDDALVHVLGKILGWTENNADQSVPLVPNPSLPEENLARNWNYRQLLKFRNHLKPAYRDAKKALDSKGEEEAINLWNGSHLFNGKFPTELSNPGKKYRDASNDFSKGAVSVGSSGGVGDSGVKPPYNKGYYGWKNLINTLNRPPKDMTIQRSAMCSKFPDFRCRKKGDGLVFTGTLSPEENSPSYKIRVEYIPSQYPKVLVLSPEIHPEAPHRWKDKSLCLFNPRSFYWHPNYLVAKYTIPWTALWLFFYEGWLETGIWYGPESPHDDAEKQP